MEVIETTVPISARLIANKASFKFKNTMIESVLTHMASQREESK